MTTDSAELWVEDQALKYLTQIKPQKIRILAESRVMPFFVLKMQRQNIFMRGPV